MVARLHTAAMTAMLLTRLQRSASRAMGKAKTATVIDTTAVSAPSSLSLRPHSALSAGNIATTICRSMKSKTINRNAMTKANHACRRGTGQCSARVGSVPRLLSAEAKCMAVSYAVP